MAIMVVYHSIHPDFSKAFDDNGDEDEFNPNPDPIDQSCKFWGRKTGTSYGPCGTMETWREDTKRIFFIPVKREIVVVVGRPC